MHMISREGRETEQISGDVKEGTLIMRTGSCPVMVGTDVAVSLRVLFLPPIQNTSIISVSEVHRQGCTKECFRCFSLLVGVAERFQGSNIILL